MEPLAKDMIGLGGKLDVRMSLMYSSKSLLREVYDAYCRGQVTPEELQSVSSIKFLQYALDTELKQFFATLGKKCPNT